MAKSLENAAHRPDTGSAVASDDNSFIDLNAIVRAFRRRLKLFLIVAALVAVAVLAIYFLIEPTYTATSQVEIRTDQRKVVDTEQVINGKLPDTYVVDTQVQVLKSRAVSNAVVDKLNLYNDVEFVGEKALTPGAALSEDARRQLATGTLAKSLKVERSGLAYVIAITYSSRNAQTASSVANTVAEVFVEMDLGTRVNGTQSARRFLQTRVDELKSQLEQKESAVQAFRSVNGILTTGAETQSQFGSLSSLEAELAQARGDAARESGRATGSSSSTSDLLAQLRKEQAEVDGQIAELRQRYGDRHPELQAALSKQVDIQAQVARENRRISSSMVSESNSISARASSLQASVSGIRARIAQENAQRVRLGELEREADAVRSLYQTYLNRLRETSAQSGLETASSQILALSNTPRLPASPNLPLFVAMAVLGGMISGFFAIALQEWRSKGMHTPADIDKALGLPVLASIPDFRSSLPAVDRRVYTEYDSSYIVKRPKSGFTESFRMLRSAMTSPITRKPYQVIAITSALPREGKSSLATAFAKVGGLDGYKAILVECDTRKLGSATRADAKVGTLQVLRGDCTLAQAVIRDESGADILPIAIDDQGIDLSTVGDIRDLITTLREHYDLIVLDMAPVLPIAEARLLCSYADATVYVVQWDKTARAASEAGLRLLETSGVNVVGVALTQVDLLKQHLYSADDVNAYYGMYADYYR